MPMDDTTHDAAEAAAEFDGLAEECDECERRDREVRDYGWAVLCPDCLGDANPRSDYEDRRDEFVAACLPDLRRDRLYQKEDVSKGIEAAPEAFCRLMRGENFGKVIVEF